MLELPFFFRIKILVIFLILSLTACTNASHKQINSNKYKITVTAWEPADKNLMIEQFTSEARKACDTYQFTNNAMYFNTIDGIVTLEGVVRCTYN